MLLALPGAGRAAAPEWTVSGWPKLEIRRTDGRHELRIGGRALFDGARIHYDEGLTRRTRPAGWRNEADVRQGRIFVSGRFFDHLEIKTEVDFAPEEPSFADAYIGWRGLGPLGTVRFGHHKIPFSFEQQVSRLALVFMERSLISALDPSVRDVGFTFRNVVLDDRLRWVVGGFRTTEATGRFFSEPTSWNLAGRVTGNPIFADEGRRVLHLGASLSHQFGNAETASVSQAPESFLADRLVDTGTLPNANRVTRVGAEIVWVQGPVSLQGEWAQDFVWRNGGSRNVTFPGFYAQASWFLTGEHRPYDPKLGRFGPVQPKQRFAPWKGGWGALQLAARVSYIDLNDREINGGRQTDTTLGINWYLEAHLRLAFNWVHGWIAGQGDVDIIQARLQISY